MYKITRSIYSKFKSFHIFILSLVFTLINIYLLLTLGLSTAYSQNQLPPKKNIPIVEPKPKVLKKKISTPFDSEIPTDLKKEIQKSRKKDEVKTLPSSADLQRNEEINTQIDMNDEFRKKNDIPEGDERKNIKIVDPTKLPVYSTIKVNQEDLPDQGPPPKVEIIVDSSGSMGQLLNSDKTKMYYLKKIMARFFNEQWKGVNENALRVYGSRRKNDCKDSFLAIPFGLKSLNEIETQVRGFYPIGRTPIYETIKNSINNIKSYKGPKRIVIFTDGEETCGGDPCKLTKETILAQKMDIKFFVVAIGFPPGKDSLKKVQCIGDTSVANNEDDMFNALGNISSQIFKGKNLKVISPDPSSYVQLFKYNAENKLEFNRIFTSSLGTTVEPGDYEAVVMIEPNYRFPRFTIPPKKKVTLQVIGEGQLKVKYMNQLLDVEMLDKNSKVITSFTSDVMSKVPAGRYKMRIFKDPFFMKLVQPVHVFPDGKSEYEVSEAGSVQFNTPGLEGFYIYDTADRLVGNFLTNFPLVLPRGEYRFHLNDKCSFDKVRVYNMDKVMQVDCNSMRNNRIKRLITEKNKSLSEYKAELIKRQRQIEQHELDPKSPLPEKDPALVGSTEQEMITFIENLEQQEKLEAEQKQRESVLDQEKKQKESLEKEEQIEAEKREKEKNY